MPQQTVISIVMPFRNAAATLPECIASIRAQTYRDFETIAVDDRSTDESAELCRRAGFKVIEAHGLVNALNAGIDAARGEYIARMDADDVMYPERLEAQLALMRDHDVVGSQVELFPHDEIRAGYREYVRWQNSVITSDQIAANLFVESPFAHPSVMMRRGFRYAGGDFPEDYELWLRLHGEGARMAKVPRVLLRWRESATRASRVDPRYSRDAFDRLRARYLAPRLPREFVVWGAGQVARRRVRLLGSMPVAWVDVDPRKIGTTLHGAPVYSYTWLRDHRAFVLIYVTNHHARDEAIGVLEEWGYRAGTDYLAVG